MNGEWLRLGIGGVVPISWDDNASKANGSGSLEGYASVYNVVDQQEDIVVPGAFRKTLADWRSSGRTIPLSNGHEFDAGSVIGSLASAEETPYGLAIKADFASTQDAQNLRTKAREKHLTGLSIFGPIIRKSTTSRGGRPIRVLQEVGLLQVALTAYPANVLAMATTAKGAMPMHHTGVVDQSWDAAAAVAAADTEAMYRHMFAVLRDGADPANKGSYALPHHLAGTNTPAVVSAVRNALARLSQTQGLSESEQAAAQMHLQAHLDDFNKTASLDPQWEDDLRAALGISSSVVRKSAISQLIAVQYPQLVNDAGSITLNTPPAPTTPVAPTDTGQPASDRTPVDEASAYALALIGESGPSTTSSPGGEPSLSLADIEAAVMAAQTSSDLDALAAEITAE